MKLSFGMIFSIILIIFFIVFAFYAIQKFLGISDEVKMGKFKDNLQSDVEKMWKSSQGSQEVEYNLPSKINKVCFKNNEYENLVFESDDFVQGYNMNHIDIEKITENENPFCIENVNGKVKMTIKKNFEDVLVRIER